MQKMEICLSFTYSQIAKKIGYNKFTEFENTVYKLQDICKKLEIIKVETTGAEEALWFFQNLVVRKSNNVVFGYSVYIPDRKEFIGEIVSNTYHKKSKSIYDSWLTMIRNIAETIENLHCFYKAEDEIITYLKDLVLFFSYASICGRRADWEEIIG